MSSRTFKLPSLKNSYFGLLTVAALVTGCDDGDDGDDGAPGPPGPAAETDRFLAPSEEAPGVVLTITGVSGASGATGNFEAGDTLSATFTLTKDDGSAWNIDEMDTTRILVSGPTFNYQPVIYQLSDVGDLAVKNANGSWTYTFATPIPSTYLAPLNDTPSFDADDGELQGQPLLDGTYTVGMYFGWNYDAGNEGHRDVGDATFDFLLGTTAGVLAPREVVTRENCNQCHQDLQFHGGLRRATTLCLLCHTAGAEDRNTPTVAGGTPGATIEFKVMAHKIHNGSHLGSVLGMTTDANGDRDYAATPEPYQLIGFRDSLHDYSDVAFPAWPNLTNEMPRDAGYSALSSSEQDQEDAQREGVTSCYLCHGDPDGGGPLVAPAQGGLAFSQPSRNACGACHDDWVTDRPYTSNMQTMPEQLSDGSCTICHPVAGVELAVMEAHLHPLRNPAFATGFNIDVLSLDEAGTNDGDGTIDEGERIAITFTIQDDAGLDIDPADLTALNTGLSGPTWDYNAFQFAAIPTDILTGPQPYTINLPQRIYYEYVGDAAVGVDSFMTDRAPHLAVPAAPTVVYERTGLGAGSSLLAADVVSPINFIDVVSAAGFARDDYIVIEDGGPAREYLQIQWVDGNRLWFSSPQTTAYPPGPQMDHTAGMAVEEVLLTMLTEGVEYDLDPVSGTIMETGGFMTGDAIIVGYTSDFELPDRYPLTLNNGPDLTEVQGGWRGKSLVDGTYSLTLWGRRDLTLDLFGESNDYRELADGVRTDFLVGDATEIEPYDLISSADNCYACHVNIAFHGNNRLGWESCLSCHGAAAAGDRTPYVAANAPVTEGVNVNFREMLHKVHMGEDLADASSYVVVGFGFGYPDNFGENTFEEIVFPAMPSGTQDCKSCHGEDSTAWIQPSDLDHPTEQVMPAQEWRLACGSCHDAAADVAHFDSNTSPADGAEACATCHAPGKDFAVEVEHLIR